ncbi:hypothetical protein BK010_05705 [Tenericutes bacterium MO-XQ]|nr:hypothetical protein BK010_05705 [Tenericutes bacterium MO-XQ]
MEKKKLTQLEHIGIWIIYFITTLYIFSLMVTFSRVGFLEIEELLLLIVAITSFVLTLLYHLNIIKNYLLVGILGIFTGIIIGGVFILVGHQPDIEDDE